MAYKDQEFLVQLTTEMERTFDLEELRQLCFELSLDSDNLRGEGKSAFIRELLLYLLRINRLDELMHRLRIVRPNANWPELSSDLSLFRFEQIAPITREPTQGDQISIGGRNDNTVIAAGRGAKAIKIDLRLLPLVITLATVVLGLSASVYGLTRKPESMSGEFNIAVAEFAEIDGNGRRLRGDDGVKLANWLYRRLSTEISDIDIAHYEIWPPDYTGPIEGSGAEERALAADELARAINANIIISGVITSSEVPQVSLEFYVNNRGFENADELVGEHYLGSPILISLPFTPDRYQGVSNPALTARTYALSQMTLGLSLYALDDFEGAIEYFERATQTEGWLTNAGKEVAYLLLGNAFARWASKDNMPQYLAEAQRYLDEAMAIKHPYARAEVTSAAVLYLQALGDPDSNQVNRDLLDAAESAYKRALDIDDAPTMANIESKVRLGLGQIYFVRYALEGGDWLQAARDEFEWITAEYENGNSRVQDLAAHSYARLGLIERLSGNHSAAAALYRQAAELGSPYYQAAYLAEAADIYATTCELELASTLFDRAVKIAEANGDEGSAEAIMSMKRGTPKSECQ